MLTHFFKHHPQIALGYSGGVDSTYLLYEGVRSGVNIKPYYVKTAFQPLFELADARRFCDFLHVPLTIIDLDILQNTLITKNPPDRCYYCKKAIFEAVLSRARDDGFNTVIDGSNASDDASERPGMKTLTELQVLSPLRECGLTKETIRRLSKEAGLFTWDKPAYSCLATRIPIGHEITKECLQKIEASENVMISLDFTDFRVRLTGDGSAKLQVPGGQMKAVFDKKSDIISLLSPYFNSITLDLQERVEKDIS